MTIWDHSRMRSHEFTFDSKVVWERYARVEAMEKFLEDGNVVVSGVFDWIIKDAEQLMGIVDAEFEMYRHHLREQKALVGAARDETGSGVLRLEHGGTSGQEVEAGQFFVLRKVHDR